jgi:glycine cleavage system aminomethyltransferase T
VAGAPAVISRTGYTGEDGFELYFGAGDAEPVWNALLGTGEVTPWGARKQFCVMEFTSSRVPVPRVFRVGTR